MPGKCKFQERWLSHERYKRWILQTNNVSEAKCGFCKKTVDISNMGESALRSHELSAKHQKAMNVLTTTTTVQDFFRRANVDNPDTHPLPSASNSGNEQQRSGNLEAFVTTKEQLSAEIIWAIKVVTSHYSYKSCEDIARLFRRMFPDSAIASKFSCGEKKCAYLIYFGLAPYFTSQLSSLLREVETFVLMFDESMNKATQGKQLDIHMRFWDCKKNCVTSRYLTSVFLGHSSAEDMLRSIVEAFEKHCVNVNKILQISMDGPHVNWRLHRLLQQQLQQDDPDSKMFLDVGSCGLHVAHNAFKHGCTSSDFDVEAVLTALYWLFIDAPARRDDFFQITGSTVFPLKFCGHCWLENVPVVRRAQEIWTSVQKYVNQVQKDKSLKEPTSKSYQTIKNACKDPLIQAKMAFFESVAKQLQPFLALFQSDNPMLVFMARHLKTMIEALMKRFVKPAILKEATTTVKLLKVDLFDKGNLLDYTKIDVGFSVDRQLRLLKQEKKISDAQLMTFRMNALKFLQTTTQKLSEKTPICYSLARNLSCFDPEVMVSDRETAMFCFRLVLTKLSETRWVRERDCDTLKWEFDAFLDKANKDEKTAFQEFSYKTDRLDDLVGATLGRANEFKNLWALVKMLLTLSHGQASVERGFSVNKEIIVENMQEKSFVAQRVVHDHISHMECPVNEIKVTNEMLTSASQARQRYERYLEDQKKRATEKKISEKRKAVDEEMGQLES